MKGHLKPLTIDNPLVREVRAALGKGLDPKQRRALYLIAAEKNEQFDAEFWDDPEIQAFIASKIRRRASSGTSGGATHGK